MAIQLLQDHIINQIAAGEVIERPANVVKELIENAIDAGATKIDIVISDSGKTLIRVTDNGCGIAPNELALAVSRHCTSKLQKNLAEILTLGFRGEALPSIGSVAQLTLISRQKQNNSAYKISVKNSQISEPYPISGQEGTTVEVENLFFTTPARLKFMKSDQAEANAINELVRRIAIAFPHIYFSLYGTQKKPLIFPSVQQNKDPFMARILQVLGSDFEHNMIPVQETYRNIQLNAYIGLPSFNRGNNLQQYIYVNGRPIRDKIILSAIRAGFLDSIAKDRHGIIILFIEIDPADIDVNVHPAKTDIRFKDSALLRSIIIKTIRHNLSHAGIRPTSTATSALVLSFKEPPSQPITYDSIPNISKETNTYINPHFSNDFSIPKFDPHKYEPQPMQIQTNYPLGAACAHIHGNYIISQTQDGFIIVDQHAAHERLVYERLKQALSSSSIPSQNLLVPELISLSEPAVHILLDYAEDLNKMGLIIDQFGPDTIIVRGIPSLLKNIDITQLIQDIAEDLLSQEGSIRLNKKIDEIAATIACHGSVRSGRILKMEEMNSLLRQMEATPASSTCNHGRPTYIELKINDIEKLFGRK